MYKPNAAAKNNRKIAEELGFKALGTCRVAWNDLALRALLASKDSDDETLPLLKAWNKGFQRAALASWRAAEVPA